MKQEEIPEDFVLYLHTIESVCEYVKLTRFQGYETVESILMEGLGMPKKVANEFICCIAYSYQQGVNEAWQKQQNMIEEKLDTTSCLQKLWNKLRMCLPSGLINTEGGTGREELNTDECLELSCDTHGLGGEERRLMQRMASTTWHPSRSVH